MCIKCELLDIIRKTKQIQKQESSLLMKTRSHGASSNWPQKLITTIHKIN